MYLQCSEIDAGSKCLLLGAEDVRPFIPTVRPGTDSGSRHCSPILPGRRKSDEVVVPARDSSGRTLIRLRSEDQKIIHAVRFHEILRVEQLVSSLGSFPNDHVFTHAMIFSVAIAINDANLRSWF